jgi:hypothetical protein
MKRPKTRKPAIQNALTGAAGTYFVAAELSRRGAVVLMTVRNTKGFDLVATSSDGNGFATFEVKSSSKRRTHRRPHFMHSSESRRARLSAAHP